MQQCPDGRYRRLLTIDDVGAVTVIAQFDDTPGGIGFLGDGSVPVVLMHRRALARVEPDGGVVPYVDLAEVAGQLINDMVVAPDGSAYIGGLGSVGATAGGVPRPDSIVFVPPAGEPVAVAATSKRRPSPTIAIPFGPVTSPTATGSATFDHVRPGHDGTTRRPSSLVRPGTGGARRHRGRRICSRGPDGDHV